MPKTMAKAGNIVINPRKMEPGSVILDMMVSIYSAVLFPGLIPGINPPFF
jgi:hypothetical protein